MIKQGFGPMKNNISRRLPGRPSSKEDSRSKILNSAKYLYINTSNKNITTRMISQHCGYNTALINYYFKNKDNLIKEVLKDTFDVFKTKINLKQDDSSQEGNVITRLFLEIREEYEALFLYSRITSAQDINFRDNTIKEWAISYFYNAVSDILVHDKYFLGKSKEEIHNSTLIFISLLAYPTIGEDKKSAECLFDNTGHCLVALKALITMKSL